MPKKTDRDRINDPRGPRYDRAAAVRDARRTIAEQTS